MNSSRLQKGTVRLSPRKNGPWVWQLRYFDMVDGVRKRRHVIIGDTRQYPTESRARAKAIMLLSSINRHNDLRSPDDSTIAELVDRFIVEEQLQEIKENTQEIHSPTVLRYSTACTYLGILNNHIRPQWGTLAIKSIKPSALQEWLCRLDVAPKTKAHIKALLHRLYEKAMLWELIELQRNPIELVEVKGVSKRIRKPVVLTVDQFEAVVAQLCEPYRTMVLVAQCTGLRVSELLALKWTDIDLGDHTLKVTRSVINGRIGGVKTECSEDYLPLDGQFATILKNWKAESACSPEGWVFANPGTLRPYHASPIQQDFIRKAGLRLGIPQLGWHTFRHTYRAWLDSTGAPVGVQQKLMRHAEIATTMNDYGNALMESKREANSKVVRMALASV